MKMQEFGGYMKQIKMDLKMFEIKEEHCLNKKESKRKNFKLEVAETREEVKNKGGDRMD
jgi:hypothetical protein